VRDSHVNWPGDQNGAVQGFPASEGSGELSLRVAEAGKAGWSSELLMRAEGEPGKAPAEAGREAEAWAPDWDALLERTVFRQEEDDPFAVGRPGWSELGQLLSQLRARDMVLLGMLLQQRYLSSAVISALFWPGLAHRGAQRRLNQLYAGHHLITRWQQLAPRRRGAAARRPFVYMLTAGGAAMIARAWDLDPKQIGRRAWKAAHYPSRVHHDLAVGDFFASLAVAAARLPGCGLYHWISDDSMRRNHELLKGSLAPDGWGRLLLPDREIRANLEWDAGTEGSLSLTSKLRLYAEQLPTGEHVLFVAPHAAREQAIRQAVRFVLGAEARSFPLLTTTPAALKRVGMLGPAWRLVGDDAQRLRLLDLPGEPRSELDVRLSLAKPYWWEGRPGGGEGA